MAGKKSTAKPKKVPGYAKGTGMPMKHMMPGGHMMPDKAMGKGMGKGKGLSARKK